LQNHKADSRETKKQAGLLEGKGTTPIAKKDSHKTSEPQGKKPNRNFAQNPKPTNRQQ